MRLPALLLLAALVAGCAQPPSSAPASVRSLPPEPAAGTQRIDVSLLSPVSVCKVVGCVGAMGDDQAAYADHTYTGFDLNVTPDGASALGPGNAALDRGSTMQATAFCVGDHATCPQGPLAQATGAWPLRLKAAGFRIVPPDELAFRIDYLGPAPVSGNGASYRFAGALATLDWPAAGTSR